MVRAMRAALPIVLVVSLGSLTSGCAAAMMTGAVVGTAATAVTTTAKVGVFAAKTGAKAAIGTGKLVYRGASAVMSSGECDPADDPRCDAAR